MAFDVVFTQHCGSNPAQQDALWNGRETVQGKHVPVSQLRVEGEHCLLAVADGVAASPSPQMASRFVLDALAGQGCGEALNGRRIRQVHERLCDRFAAGPRHGSSTTLVAAQCHGAACEIVNVGDSRAYWIAADGQWRQISRDHTILNEMLARGEAEPGKEYAQIYQGLMHCLIADYEADDFPVEYERLTWQPGARLLLCTDGVHDTLGDDRLRRLYKPGHSAQEQVAAWRNAVLHAGAPDNFSIILASILTSAG